MTPRSILPLALGALLGFAAGCAEPVAPPAPPTAPAPPAAAPEFPALSRPGEIYVADSSLYGVSTYHGGWLASRLVLYGENRFGLQFSSPQRGFHEYTGSYTRTDTAVDFAFDDSNTAGLWQATGALRGDSLTIKYNIVMGLADFLDGVYVRSPGTP